MMQRSGARQAVPWVWLTILAGVVAFFGGSSRPDQIQLAALRPATALLLIPALYYLGITQLREGRVLVWLLGLLAGWMALQIIPLPPSAWQSLPGRDVIFELDRAIDLKQEWRPISFVPSRGWNALASLIVPATALLLALSVRATQRMLLLLVAGLGVLDAILGLLQVISGPSSPLYFYTVTNRAYPVGIFANENHSAVFSAVALLVIARLGATSRQARGTSWLGLAYPPAFLIVLMSALVSGSRAGIAMTLFALIASTLVFWLRIDRGQSRKRVGSLERWLVNRPRALLAVSGAVIVSLIILFVGLERAPGLEDMLTRNPFEDLRTNLWPILQQMIKTHWLVGIGFGSFEDFYHIYEPTELLLPTYVNQAHNDWAQLIIEGGLPAFMLLVVLLGWIAASLRVLLSAFTFPAGRVLFWISVITILCAASIVDYPLRTPTFQLVATWLLLALALERENPEAAL